jgi:tetratricopeptide (TPR) repeat protein
MRRPPASVLLFPFVLLLGAGLWAETVLVLPFSNLSQVEGLDWVGESVCEGVADTLAAEGLLVLDREDRMEAYHRMTLREYAPLTRATVLKIGESLDADFVVFGRFQVSGDSPARKRSIRLWGRVLDLKRLRQSGELTQTAPLDDLAAVQVNLAWEVFRYLRPAAAGGESEFKRSRRGVRVDAMESYIRGLVAASDEQRHRHFAQAARLDAGYSQPRFRLGRLYWAQKNYQLAVEWLLQVAPNDQHYREAIFLLGLSRYYLGDFSGAEESFTALGARVPLNEVFNNLGAAQCRRGRPEALVSFSRALEGDESDPDYHFNVGYELWRQGSFEKAAERFRAVLDRRPDDGEATLMLGRCLKQSPAGVGEASSEPGPRLKQNFDETPYRQLKEMLEPKSQ